MNKLLLVSNSVFSLIFFIRTSSENKHTKLHCLEKNFQDDDTNKTIQNHIDMASEPFLDILLVED